MSDVRVHRVFDQQPIGHPAKDGASGLRDSGLDPVTVDKAGVGHDLQGLLEDLICVRAVAGHPVAQDADAGSVEAIRVEELGVVAEGVAGLASKKP